MNGDRVILAVKYTPATSAREVRRAVGGFLRYVQYRDKHADAEPPPPPGVEVRGLLKYLAYRDRATPAGRLFGPAGVLGDQERRDFATFVGKSINATRPTRARSGGEARDRRRAVYRFVLSPERAAGLNLDRLTRAAVERLERDSGVGGLRWVAAEHRNTSHPHVHLVVAGMRESAPGKYRSFLLTPRRLAAMKEELALEISRQRGASRADAEAGRAPSWLRAVPLSPSARGVWPTRIQTQLRTRRAAHVRRHLDDGLPTVFARLQTAALRYRRRLAREAEEERRRRELEFERG